MTFAERVSNVGSMKHLSIALSLLSFTLSAQAVDIPVPFAGAYYKLVEARTNGTVATDVKSGVLFNEEGSNQMLMSLMTMRPDHVSPIGYKACNDSYMSDITAVTATEITLMINTFAYECSRDGGSAHEHGRQTYEGSDRLEVTYHYRTEGTRLYLQSPHRVDGEETYDDAQMLVFERQN